MVKSHKRHMIAVSILIIIAILVCSMKLNSRKDESQYNPEQLKMLDSKEFNFAGNYTDIRKFSRN